MPSWIRVEFHQENQTSLYILDLERASHFRVSEQDTITSIEIFLDGNSLTINPEEHPAAYRYVEQHINNLT